MTGLSRYESLIDQQIRLAQERGDFDDLPGMGKPLPGKGEPDDEQWWLKGYLRREGLPTEVLLPPSLRLAREAERLPETVRDLPSEPAVRAAVADLNRRIAEHVRTPSGPQAPLTPVNADNIVRQWRAARAGRSGSAPAGPAPSESPAAPRRGGWRRWLRRSI